jgi:hypothetical protein
MRVLQNVLCALLGSGMSILSFTASAVEQSPTRLMMEASGIVEQYAEIDDNYRTNLRQIAEMHPKVTPEMADALADIAGKAMDPARFLEDVEKGLTDALSPKEIAAFTEFYSSPLGRRLEHLETAASQLTVRQEIETQAAALIADLEKSPDRLALADEIDDAILGSEMSAVTTESMFSAMAVGVLEGQGRSVAPSMQAEIRARIEGMHDALRQDSRRQWRILFARTYRDVSTPDLRAYADFLESDSGRAVYSAFATTVEAIVTARGREVGAEFATWMRQKGA